MNHVSNAYKISQVISPGELNFELKQQQKQTDLGTRLGFRFRFAPKLQESHKQSSSTTKLGQIWNLVQLYDFKYINSEYLYEAGKVYGYCFIKYENIGIISYLIRNSFHVIQIALFMSEQGRIRLGTEFNIRKTCDFSGIINLRISQAHTWLTVTHGIAELYCINRVT